MRYAIKGGAFRTWGLRAWSVRRPLKTILSMVGNVVNSIESSDKEVGEQAQGHSICWRSSEVALNLTVFSHKPCWSSKTSPTGYATDGGFPFQMAALSELFGSTRLVVPCSSEASPEGEAALTGKNLPSLL